MNSGDDEQNDLQEADVFVRDTSPGSGPSHQRCTLKKKIILSLLIAVVILVVAIPIVVTQTKKSTSSNKEEITDVDPHKLKCVYDVPGTDTKDPLKKKCNPDSKYVKDKCREDALHANCQYCDENAKTRILLPKFCFCDKFEHCPEMKDAQRKEKCLTCLKTDFCPCLPHGNCTCGKESTAEHLRCNCNPGYEGFYCNYVPKRLCSYPNKTTGGLPDCYQSTADKCFIIAAVSNATLECVIFKGKNIPSGLSKCVTIKEKGQE